MARLVRVLEPIARRPCFAWLDGEVVRLTGVDTFPPPAASLDLPALVFHPGMLLAPLRPGKIVAVASSYPKHVAEMGKTITPEPRLFLKPPSAVIGPGEAIALPPGEIRVDPEGELAIVIGRPIGHGASRRGGVEPRTAEVMQAVFGYTICNDVTVRTYQKTDGIFGRAKGFDTFCPIGPWIDTELDPHDLALQCAVNGEVRARGRTSDLLYLIPELIAFVADVMTLEPGDLITTGTPPGVAPIAPGDVVTCSVEGLGDLVNPVVARG